MFLARKKELQALNAIYHKEGMSFVVIYGRRRVGKTALINELCKGKKCINYMGIEQNDHGALVSFTEKVLDVYPSGRSMIEDKFPSWDKAFEYIAHQTTDEKIILSMDEYPYIAAGNPSISSVLQKHIDTSFRDKEILIILCGSSMSFMENQVLGYKSPLYGRRTAQFKIEPLDYLDVSEFFSSYTPEEKMIAYGITGGIPQYINNVRESGNLRAAITENFLDTTGHLHEEPSNLLKQELREPAMYNSIITAIANGATKINDIANRTGEDSKKCLKYIKTLIELEIIYREHPIGVESSRKSLYFLKDKMFRFWYRFIPKNIININAGMGSIIYDMRIEPDLPDYMGRIFEDISMEYLVRKNQKLALPFMFDEIGRWWGANPALKQQEEIDIVAVSGKMGLFCECKWRNKKAGIEVLEALKRKSSLLEAYSDKYYMIFSKSGFTDTLIEEANNNEHITLIAIEDMFEI